MNTPCDRNGQPLNYFFCREKNRSKAASTLYGILNGIVADKSLNCIEIEFLRNWLEQQEEKKGDFLDLYDAVTMILEDGIITKEEKEDLFELMKDCIEYSDNFFLKDELINRFLGFLKGIGADGKINRTEVKMLKKELDNMKDLILEYPFNIVYGRLEKFLNNKNLNLKNLEEMHNLLTEITGTNFTKDGDAIGGPTALYSDDLSKKMEGIKICFTGSFYSASRTELESLASQIGFLPQKNITLDTNCLIIGTGVSRDWIHSSSGRKIEKAIKMKNKNIDIIISNEKKWIDYLEKYHGVKILSSFE